MFVDDTLAFFHKDEYDLILCRPDKEEICIINEYKLDELKILFKDIDELHFKVNKYTEEKLTHKSVENKYYNMMLKNYLVLLLNKNTGKKHYFIIDSIEENTDNTEKTIVSYGLEYIFNKDDFPPLLEDYTTCQLYKDPNDKIHTSEGILNLLEEVTGCKIAYVSEKAKNDYKIIKENKSVVLTQNKDQKTIHPTTNYNYEKSKLVPTNKFTQHGIIDKYEIDKYKANIENEEILEERKYRTLQSDGGMKINTYIKDCIEKAFDVIVFFDTDKEEFYVYEQDELSIFEDLYFTEDNYVKYVKNNITDNEVITKLHVYGNENITIDEINPLGGDYLENYNYYKNTKYMSKDMLKRFKLYEESINKKNDEFQDYLKQIKEIEKTLVSKEIELNKLKTNLEIENIKKDEYLTLGKDLSLVNVNVRNAEIEVKNCESFIKQTQMIKESLNEELKRIGNDIKKDNFFTKEDLKALQKITHVSTWNNENIYKKEDLMLYGNKALEDLSVPTVEFSMEVSNLIRDLDFKSIDRLKVGKKVLVHIPEHEIEVFLTIIEITINDESTNLTLSNKKVKQDIMNSLSGSLGNIQKATSGVIKNKYIWDKTNTLTKTVREMREGNLDAAKNNIFVGSNNQISLDGRGIGLKDANNPNEQIRMVNNAIVMTRDGWENASLAVTPRGIVAENLIGKMLIGENLIIQNPNNSMVINEDGIDIQASMFRVRGGIPDEMIPSAKNWNKIESNLTSLINEKTKALDIGLNKLSDGLDTYLGDGYITAGEASVLETTFKQIEVESEKLNVFANELDISDELQTYNMIYNKLSYELSAWIKREEYPLPITDLERFNIKKLMGEIQSAKTLLQNKINEVLAQNAEKNAKEYARKQVEQVDNTVKDLEGNINKFSDDGYLTLSEANILKNQSSQLESEAKDLIELGTSLKISNEVNSYVDSLKSLKQVLSMYLNKDGEYPLEITQLDRDRIKTEFDNVQNYKIILSNKIYQILNNNAINEAKTYTNTQFELLDEQIKLSAKQVDIDKLSNRVQTAEILLKPDSITNTVRNSFDYRKDTVVPKETKLKLIRNSKITNPLESLNYNSKKVYKENEFVLHKDVKPKNYNYKTEFEIIDDIVIRYGSYATVTSELQQTLNVVQQKITDDSITNVIKTSEYMKGVNLTIDGIDERVVDTNTELNLLKKQIELKVSDKDVQNIINPLHNDINQVSQRMTDTESSINLMKENIELKVSKQEVNSVVYQTNKEMRNIIINSGQINNLEYWSLNYGGGADEIKLWIQDGMFGKGAGTKTTLRNSGWTIMHNDSLTKKGFKFTVGSKYVLSGKIWSLNDNAKIKIQICDGNNTNEVVGGEYIFNSGYNDFAIPFTANITGNENKVRFNIASDNTGIFVPFVKLNEGEKATEWTPAPEDVGIDKVNKTEIISSINMSPETIKLNASKIDMTGIVTISDLKNTGKVEINGGNIKGGTLILGGISNGSGNMRILDVKGNEVVKIDNKGLDLTMRYYNDTTLVEALRVKDQYGNVLLSINSAGMFNFAGHIAVGSSASGYTTISPTQIGFPNVVLKADTRVGTLDIGGVWVGGGGLFKVSEINYRGNVNGVTIYDGNTGLGSLRCGSLTVSGSKQRIVKTKNYGIRGMNAFETCEPYFGDIKRNKIINGRCEVKIDNIFKETIKIENGYEVITWKYGKGDIYVDISSMTEESFTVYCDNDIEFAYAIVGKQMGVEDIRMEKIEDLDENAIKEKKENECVVEKCSEKQ